MAAVERFVINVKGKQTHGSAPWSGTDPILISAKVFVVSKDKDIIAAINSFFIVFPLNNIINLDSIYF